MSGFVDASRTDGRVALWWCLGVLTAGGVFARSALAILDPTTERPDEVFQNLEPAYRLFAGQGVVTWEWREGIRSWLFPDVLAAIMHAARLLGLPDAAILPSVWVVLSLVAASGIAVACLIGWNRFGLLGAAFAGAAYAGWPDLVYYGPKTLVEVQGGNLLLIAAGLATLESDRGTPSRLSRLIAIGALLALAFDLRFQLAPALALVAFWVARLDRRAWAWLGLGAVLPLAVLGLIDALALGSPFKSIWGNIAANLLQDKASAFGVAPFYWYATKFAWRYGFAVFPVALFFAIGVRCAPLLALTSVTVLAFHSLISHKEISFVYAALPPAIIVVGLGMARTLRRLARLRAHRQALPVAGMALLWAMIVLYVGLTRSPAQESRDVTALRTIWQDLRARPELCGLGLYGADFPWWATLGYAGLQRPVKIYLPDDAAELAADAPGFNYVVANTASTSTLAAQGYQSVSCTAGFCIAHRQQPCQPIHRDEFSSVLERRGK